MKRLFALMLLAHAPLAMAATEAGTADIATISWAAGNRDALNASPGLPRQAEALLARLLPDADLIAPSVGESRFVDVDGNGTLELVSTVDYSGRAFYTHVVVVEKRQGRLTWSVLAGQDHRGSARKPARCGARDAARLRPGEVSDAVTGFLSH